MLRVRCGLGADIPALLQFINEIAPVADRAESDLREWATILEGLVGIGATRGQILAYNAAATQLYEAQQKVAVFLLEAGWTNIPTPAVPPMFGTALRFEPFEFRYGWGWIKTLVRVHAEVPSGEIPVVRAIYEKPWWQDAVDRAVASAASAKGTRGFWVIAAPYVGKALLWMAAGVAITWASDALLHRTEEFKEEFNRMTFKQNTEKMAAYRACFNSRPTNTDTLVWSKHCAELTETVYTQGVAPTGFFEDLVPIVKWTALGVIAVFVGKALIERRRDPLRGVDYLVGKRVQLHPGTDAWMRGDRYGVVVAKGNKGSYRVKLDKSGKTIRLPTSRFEEV